VRRAIESSRSRRILAVPLEIELASQEPRLTRGRLQGNRAGHRDIERWHKSLKGECIRPGTPLSLEDARRLVEGYVEHDNNVRLNSAVGYITPNEMLAGRQAEIDAERDQKLEEVRKQGQIRRQQDCVKDEDPTSKSRV
jgi:hypothetical protein